ncbi:DUF1178 family protein [Gluconacetobacter asukensis]|uniref:DUF1178 family protein n=1 Tax=Gluconacetobacter asukensis TaxID=1017181 RepID=A0A7W4P1P0_9PROT|nr:DUF1178 family protein [Gluconacetobacter asukensis]
MICYQLRCDAGHEFEGWFPGSAAFDDQARRNLLSCPQCGTSDVVRALMAPAVRTAPARVPEGERPRPEAGAAVPAAMMAAMQRLRQYVEERCENVGDKFADEALKIHHGDAEQRGIYGQASEEECDRLADEGVEIMAIPWVPRADG